MNEIDFVLLWVDGNDPKWRKEFEYYTAKHDGDKRDIRFRDWNILRYLFRAFESFTPWVRKIHFVTWGHLPHWLNADHPKLHIVRHSEYMDENNLPVFNANPIEINMYRINDLAEHFVFFNDDLFIVSPIPQDRFFKDGLPCDMAIANALSSSSGTGHFVLNDLEILNRHFDKRTAVKRNVSKWFSPRYGKEVVRNLALMPWPRFTGFVDPHMPQPFLKSTFEELWAKEAEVLAKTSASKFRSCDDINQYLFRYWQLAKGTFHPVSMCDTRYVELTKVAMENSIVEEAICSGRYAMICLNDSDEMNDIALFEKSKQQLIEYFEAILPQRSSFEK